MTTNDALSAADPMAGALPKTTETRNVADIVLREDLYPRLEKNAKLVQQYAENLDVLPPIEINQNNELIDGWHRWTAHRKADASEIAVKITPTKNGKPSALSQALDLTRREVAILGGEAVEAWGDVND
jgi:hypothetical protein